MVIASRYSANGRADGLQGWRRKAASRLCKWLAQALLLDRARNVSDPLSGFFLIRRSLVQGAGLRPLGYKIGLEILSRVRPEKIDEVPYEFAPRQAGQSKASLRQGFTFLLHLFRLLREVPQAGRAWKFTFVGALGVLVNLTLLFLLSVTAGLPRGLAWFLAVEAAVLHNFIWHQSFTWRDRREAGAGAWLRRATTFHLSVAGTVAINGTLFGLLSIVGAPLILAGMAGIGAAAAFNFVAGDRWVFKPLRAGKQPLGA
jgi:dolichol-phosphate mannosyltransferase